MSEISGADAWNSVMHAMNKESARGAAILAAKHIERSFARFLQATLSQKKRLAKSMFTEFGPLARVRHQVALAYAFGEITDYFHQDLTAIIDIGDYFYNAPLEAGFNDLEVRKSTKRLGTYQNAKKHAARLEIPEHNLSEYLSRHSFVMACAICSGRIYNRLEQLKSEEKPQE